MDFRVYLEKLRALSDNQKKIILWIIVAILALVLGFWWVKMTGERVRNFQTNELIKNLNPSNLEANLVAPDLGKREELERAENLIKSLEENSAKLQELEKMIEENPDRAAELLINSDKLEEFLKF